VKQRDLIADVGQRFKGDVAGHEMTIIRDDGLYRHVRFKQPKQSFYWFDLITWPGCLAINGDMDSYLFSRMEDMFEFFRARSGWNLNTINPQYWAEKLRASSKVTGYSEEKFRALLAEAVAEASDEFPQLAKAVEHDILDGWSGRDISTEETAHFALRDFEYWLNPDDRYKAGARPDFQFTDAWEWDFTEWDHRFLWCCHAIQWGIGVYDGKPAVAAVTPDGQ
jgi:hypothetical protein